MKIETEDLKSAEIFNNIPAQINDSELLHLLDTADINWYYIYAFKNKCQLTDNQIAELFDISVRTLRSKKSYESKVKQLNKEHVVLIISLFKLGNEVFGSNKIFEIWLNTENFFFDNKKPSYYLASVTGIRFVEDRLVAMKFGDNV